MLKKRRSLRVAFVCWLLGGFIIVFALPIFAKISLCTPESPSNASNRSYLSRSGLCEEAKLTDVALVFFTYCLVVIGWFTVRSAERTTRNSERAYIFATPKLARAKTPRGNYAVEIWLHNYGRTAGTINAIYGEVSPNVEPFGRPIYRNGSVRTANGMLPPTEGQPIQAPVTFECPAGQDFFFFGYIVYDDLSGESHTSRFCAKIFLNSESIEAAGSEAFHDWN